MNTVPTDRPGGSAIELITPCNSGTSSLKAFRDGAGVGMVETLRDTGLSKWEGHTFITPQVDDVRDAPIPTYTAGPDGVVRITADNLGNRVGSRVGDARRTWPQVVSIDSLQPVPAGESAEDCRGQVYLGSYVEIYTRGLHILFRPETGVIRMVEVISPFDGTWRFAVTATSPAGEQTRIKSVGTRAVVYASIPGHAYHVRVSRFTHLEDFREIRVTATNAKNHLATYVTILRTP